jgi:hypothetical protein
MMALLALMVTGAIGILLTTAAIVELTVSASGKTQRRTS